MKNTLIEVLTLILLCLAGLAGALSTPEIAVLPEAWLKYVPLALILILALKNAIYVFLDWKDDGLLNKSYKLPKHLPWVMLCGLCLCSMSCEAIKTMDWKEAGNRAGLLMAQLAVAKAEAGIAEELAKPKPDQKRLISLQFALMEAHNLIAELQGKRVPHDVLPQSDWTGGKVPVL
jgi:hypothetical protein